MLVTARQFPGISASTLDSSPPAVTAQTRRFTAPELVIDSEQELDADHGIRRADRESSEEPDSSIQADVGDVRSRLGDGESMQTRSTFGAIDTEETWN